MESHKTNVEEFVYGVEINPKQKITFDSNVYEEHEEHKWCSFEKAIELLKWPDNKKALKRLNLILTSNNERN